QRLFVGVEGLLAVLADAPSEALGEDEHERGGHEEWRDAHVEEASHSRRGVVRVQRSEHEMAGEGGADADLRRLEIAGLAHEDDVRILAEEGAQGACEGAADLLIDLDLVYPFEVVLDGILG